MSVRTYQQAKATDDIHACHPWYHLVQVTELSLKVPSPLSLWDSSRIPSPFGDIFASEHHG